MAHQSVRSPSGPSRSKSVLFCPSCGREGHVDGDWPVYPTLGGDVYRCPSCHGTVTVRAAERNGTSTVTPLVTRSVALAFAWLPCAPASTHPDARSRSRSRPRP